MSKLPLGFWAREPVAPIPFLAGLREIVLDRSDRRCPKWRFRFAPDLAIQIQPRPVHMISPAAKARGFVQRVILFECLAVQGDDLSAAVFQPGNSHMAPFRLNFELFAEDGAEAWTFRPTHIRWSRRQEHPEIASAGFRARVLTELGSGRLDRLEPGMMFQPACLCCGRGLTDPASMARWIRPECAGTTSLDAGLFGLRLSDEGAP